MATLYVNNLNEKIKKNGMLSFVDVSYFCCGFGKGSSLLLLFSLRVSSNALTSVSPTMYRVPDLAKSMKAIFGQFGNIIDVVCRDTYRLRGQAWVVFEHEEDAAAALRQMQGFPMCNKPIRIAYAKTKSDSTAKLDGTYNEAEVEARRQRRRLAWEAEKARKAGGTEAPMHGEPAGHVARPTTAMPAVPEAPNCILFVENLPAEANEAMLLLVFQRYPGLKEVRMVPGRPGIAFVEYDNESGAAAAMAGLQGFRLATDKPMAISFSKQR